MICLSTRGRQFPATCGCRKALLAPTFGRQVAAARGQAINARRAARIVPPGTKLISEWTITQSEDGRKSAMCGTTIYHPPFTIYDSIGSACMRTSLVLTLIGDDRPGIVEQLADQVMAAGANWEESRMARLAGKFAGILRVSVEADRAQALRSRLAAVSPGLTLVVETAEAEPAPATHMLRLDLLGQDHPGIIRDISRVLVQHGVNIEELETDLTSAPMSGEALFRARARVRMPPTLSLDSLRRRLENLAGELMVDLTVDEGDRSPGAAEPGAGRPTR
jgi:glycine cleavage system regulatory protein